MAGHSKWANIKHRKAASDFKKGKEFTRCGKEIALAAKMGGGDPAINSSLALAIERAKACNFPNANIERAIKSGTGELKDGSVIEEIWYEGYAPGGIAIYVRTLTDNKNRAVSSVRHIFSKYGGNFGTSGSVSFLFHKKGMLSIAVENKNIDELMLQMIDLGALDVQESEGRLIMYTDPQQLSSFQKKLEAQNFEVQDVRLTFIPESTISIEDVESADKVIKFINLLEEEEDVDEVFSNMDIPENILSQLSL